MEQQAQAGAVTAALPVTTAFELQGWRIERQVGVCFGLVVRSVGLAKGVTGAFRSLKAGEVPQYTQLLEDSRRHAMDRMIENARLLGANAVIGMRFDSAEVADGLAEIVAYGTAVVATPA
jgi:uncharacterized protein YbjQ (UPF0145 family)